MEGYEVIWELLGDKGENAGILDEMREYGRGARRCRSGEGGGRRGGKKPSPNPTMEKMQQRDVENLRECVDVSYTM